MGRLRSYPTTHPQPPRGDHVGPDTAQDHPEPRCHPMVVSWAIRDGRSAGDSVGRRKSIEWAETEPFVDVSPDARFAPGNGRSRRQIFKSVPFKSVPPVAAPP